MSTSSSIERLQQLFNNFQAIQQKCSQLLIQIEQEEFANEGLNNKLQSLRIEVNELDEDRHFLRRVCYSFNP